MFIMLLFILRVHKYIINKHNHQAIHKHLIHQVNECRMCICKSKRHDSNSYLVLNALFGIYFSLIFNWWYLDGKSILEKTLIPYNWSNRSTILGNGYFFLIVTHLSSQKWMYICIVPSFFFTNKTGALQWDTFGLMNFLSNSSCSCSCSPLSSAVAILYEAFYIGAIPSTKSIVNCTSWFGGILGNSSGKLLAKSRTTFVSSIFGVVLIKSATLAK